MPNTSASSTATPGKTVPRIIVVSLLRPPEAPLLVGLADRDGAADVGELMSLLVLDAVAVFPALDTKSEVKIVLEDAVVGTVEVERVEDGVDEVTA